MNKWNRMYRNRCEGKIKLCMRERRNKASIKKRPTEEVKE